MNDLVLKLNDILKEFEENLYISLNPRSVFSLDSDNTLCFENNSLCKANDLVLTEYVVTVSYIIFHFNANRFIRLDFVWSEDENPIVNSYSIGFIKKDYTFDAIEDMLSL